MNRKLISTLLVTSMILMSVANARAGGPFESFDITGAPVVPPNFVLAKVIQIKWDPRTIPVPYKVNNSFGVNVPNPLGAPVITLAQATTALQASLDAWNSIPSAYISSQINGQVNNPGLVRFDMINELSFRTANTFGAIASSPSVNFIIDVNLVNGNDIDGDGDSDVSSAISVIADVDADGDHEFPAGAYKAGTILDNDVQFNTKVSNGFRFTIDDAQADTNPRSVDLECVAVHEFGHSIGLAHAMDNQTNSSDGNGATMFPLIDTGDPAAELNQASLDIDDIAWAAMTYPEGSATSGPGALQAGDVAFNSAWGKITGEVRHGVLNQPVAGANVYAVNRDTGEQTVTAYSGTTNLLRRVDGALFIPADVNLAIPNGNFTIAVPEGNYSVGVEPVDGLPVSAPQVNFTTQIGAALGQQNFVEEFYNNMGEGAIEVEADQEKNVHVNIGQTNANTNIITNAQFVISPFGPGIATPPRFIGFTFGTPPANGAIYAVQFPAAEVSALNGGNPTNIQAGLIDSGVVDASAPVLFAKASLCRGVINPDTTATIDLANPLDSAISFLAADNDFGPYFFKNPQELSRKIRDGFADGSIQNLFLVVQTPLPPFVGVSNQPPLVGLSIQAPILGRSFLSLDGGLTFNRRNDVNFRFSLVASQIP